MHPNVFFTHVSIYCVHRKSVSFWFFVFPTDAQCFLSLYVPIDVCVCVCVQLSLRFEIYLYVDEKRNTVIENAFVCDFSKC